LTEKIREIRISSRKTERYKRFCRQWNREATNARANSCFFEMVSGCKNDVKRMLRKFFIVESERKAAGVASYGRGEKSGRGDQGKVEDLVK
jgi:hypothetical protein